MKIKIIEAFLMSFRMPQPLKLAFWGGERIILKRDAMLIRVTAENGLQGYAPGPADERVANEIKLYGHAGMYPFPLADEILKEPLDINSGYLTVPNESGLGIEINEQVIEKYPFIPGTWSIFQLKSPLKPLLLLVIIVVNGSMKANYQFKKRAI